MSDDSDPQSSIVRQLIGDPVRLRRVSRYALALFAGLAAASRLLPGGFVSGILTAVIWIVAPLIAFGIGIGDAFFVRYGRGRRRVLLTIVASVIAASASCTLLVFITERSQNTVQEIVEAIIYAGFYVAFVVGLSGVLAFAIGLGTDYAARRINELNQDDW